MADIELVIKIPKERYKDIQRIASVQLKKRTDTVEQIIANGIPLEEIPNPCIECSQNCCVCELNGENCECQKVFMIKENKQ